MGGFRQALKAFVSDSDPKVREAGAKCFWAVHSRFAGHADSLLATLEPAPKKLIARYKPK